MLFRIGGCNGLLTQALEQDHMHEVHWDHYPLVASTPFAQEWLEIQAKIGLAPNTVEAYGRGLNDFLAFYQQYSTPFRGSLEGPDRCLRCRSETETTPQRGQSSPSAFWHRPGQGHHLSTCHCRKALFRLPH